MGVKQLNVKNFSHRHRSHRELSMLQEQLKNKKIYNKLTIEYCRIILMDCFILKNLKESDGNEVYEIVMRNFCFSLFGKRCGLSICP
jgi:hypothetical protein